MDGFEGLLIQFDREFRGKTFNGKSLMETCRSLTAQEAARKDTYEGYSAWDNLVHCNYYKYDMLRILGKAPLAEPYLWAEGGFPPINDTSPEAWAQALDYSEVLHDALVATLKDLPRETLDRPFEKWKCTLWEFLFWLVTHDAYHNAQIRNMGLEVLKMKKNP